MLLLVFVLVETDDDIQTSHFPNEQCLFVGHK